MLRQKITEEKMFDINGKDNSSYNIDNIALIKKASPKVGA